MAMPCGIDIPMVDKDVGRLLEPGLRQLREPVKRLGEMPIGDNLAPASITFE